MSGDVYLDTVARLEPDIAMIDPGAFYASAAISLKRIADIMQPPVPGTIGQVITSEELVYSLRSWCCEWDKGQGPICNLINTREDRCRCEQQARSIMQLIIPRKPK